MLETSNLTKHYNNGHTALNSLNLKVAPGEIFCLLGANGAGKTTTINLFLGFAEPSAGSASVNGLVVAKHPLETKRHLAYIPEQVNLYRNLTGLENLRYFASLGQTGASDEELIAALEQAGLAHDAINRRVGTYSKGMRQKVGIAIAFAKKAGALLLDEPTSGLDPRASNEFSELLKQFSAQGGAVLMATHDLFRAKDCGTRLGIMREGKLLTVLESKDVNHVELEKLYLTYMQ